MTWSARPPGESREFDADEYTEAIRFLESLAEAGVERVLVERYGHGAWRPLFAGPPSMGVYGLARLQEIEAPPAVRIGPAADAEQPTLLRV